jgi:TusE/DsrC/DsvC family sulfur relay protein
MLSIDVRGRMVPLGPKGFIACFEDWDEDVAQALAEQEGLELLQCHWTAIEFARDYFRRWGIPPTPKVMIREVGTHLHSYRCTYRTLKELFPGGGCKQACRLAGLPEYYCYAC